MKFLVRQTYTTASLVAMIPAAIWSVSWYGGRGMIHTIGRFPYVYLFICQFMVVPRYVAAAWLIVWFARQYKQFHELAGFIGCMATGVVIDAWLTFRFAAAIAEPPPGNYALFIPLCALLWGLAAMLAVGLVAGFGYNYVVSSTKRSR